jgi:hypothetical protein
MDDHQLSRQAHQRLRRRKTGESLLWNRTADTLKARRLEAAEDEMAVTAIHPGEHLAEELKELGMSASELGRKLNVPTNPHHRHHERKWGDRSMRFPG